MSKRKKHLSKQQLADATKLEGQLSEHDRWLQAAQAKLSTQSLSPEDRRDLNARHKKVTQTRKNILRGLKLVKGGVGLSSLFDEEGKFPQTDLDFRRGVSRYRLAKAKAQNEANAAGLTVEEDEAQKAIRAKREEIRVRNAAIREELEKNPPKDGRGQKALRMGLGMTDGQVELANKALKNAEMLKNRARKAGEVAEIGEHMRQFDVKKPEKPAEK